MTQESASAASHQLRIKTGLAFAVVAVALVLAGGWFWVAFVTVMFLQGFRELNDIMKAKNIRPSQTIVISVGMVLVLLAGAQKTHYFAPVISAGIMASFFRLLFRQPRASINDIGATLLAIFYVAYLPIHFILLRNLDSQGISNPLAQPGLGYLFLTILVISASDIAAYYAGKRFGKILLYPDISPKKTREGALGGIIGGVTVGLLFAAYIGFPWDHALLLSLILIIVGQLGDLSESLLKRDAGVKDSGAMLQGHGGLLDRIDSYIFSGAVSYYYIYWVVLQRGLAQDLLQLFSG